MEIIIPVGYLGPLSNLNNHLAQLDCLLSFAVAAISSPNCYTRPKMFPEGSGILELKQLRHPCLELQEDVTFIPNDCYFKKGKTLSFNCLKDVQSMTNICKDEAQMIIITGPNMGGKSTYIRSIGAAVLMAHVGAFVPCESASISIVDSILGRIGADDNFNKGLSTFMVEMIETSQIIRVSYYSQQELIVVFFGI